MMNEKPTKPEEKSWLQRIADHGCVITGQSNIQLHHCVGREGKQDKYHIGRWFVLPLAFELHDVSSNNPLNVTHHRKAFVEAYGKECDLFWEMCMSFKRQDPLPFDAMVLKAILNSNR